MYHTIEYWDLLRKGKLKPTSSGNGKIKYSSAQYKKFFSTSRIPGETFDHIAKHFLAGGYKHVHYSFSKHFCILETEGTTPNHGIIAGKGRIFMFQCTHGDGSIILPQELLIILQTIRTFLDYEPIGDCISVLTHADRSSWARV